MLNEDTSSVNFKNFHGDENSLYPSVSLCFEFDILQRENADMGWYQSFLSGCEYYDDDCTWNASFADISYDDVTVNLMDYVLGERTEFTDKVKYWYMYRMGLDESIESTAKDTYTWGYTGDNRVYTSRRRFDEK